MRNLAAPLCGLLILLGSVHGQVSYATNQLTESALPESAQRALFSQPANSFLLPVATGTPSAAVLDNAAGRLILADKGAFPFLATLPGPGMATFFAALKPCAILNVHSHPRASEQYIVLSGTMTGGIAQEVGAAENVTFTVQPGQVMLVPQGVWHYNYNNNCSPLVLVINYNSADPGTIALNLALSGMTSANPQAAAAGNFTSSAGSFGPFALDQTCLSRCGLPSTGASGNGLSGLSQEFQTFLGVASGPSTSTSSSGPPTGASPPTVRAPGTG